MDLPRLSPFTLALLCAFTTAKAEDEMTLSTVSVTAKGYASADLETPLSLTALDRDEIVRRGAGNVGDALRGEPGIAVSSDSAQGQNPLIRGLGKESMVLLVDGMRLNSAQPAGAIASFMTLGLAERVEVVKGGASVLYGTGALGGAINVLMPQARFKPGVGADAGASYDSVSQGLRGTAVVNASADDHALMLGTSLARIDDYKSPAGRVTATGYDSDAFIGQYRFRIDGQQQLRVSAQRHQDKDVWYPGSTRPHPHPLVGSATVHSPKQERRLYEIGYGREDAGAAPLNFDVRVYRQDMARTINSWANNARRDMVTNEVTFRTDGLDAKVDWLAHPQHMLSLGINAWKMTGNPDRHMSQPSSPPPPLVFGPWVTNNPFQDAEIRALGLYVQDDMYFDRVNVLAGLRWDAVQGDAESMNPDAPNPAMRRFSGLKKKESAVSGSLGAIYEATPLLRPYANYARAFRAPGMRERFESGPRGDGYYYTGSPEVEAEKADQLEIGIKGGTAAFNYQVSAFHNKINNYLTGRIMEAATTPACAGNAFCKKTVNLGSATIKGAEARIAWQVARNHWLNVGYSRIRGENDDLDEPLFQMPADEISLGWIGHLVPAVKADFTLRLVDEQTRVATQFTHGTENRTAGFVTADLGTSWQFTKQQSLRMAVQNVANKSYHEHLTEGVSGNEIKAPGRNVQISWRGSF